MYDVIHFEALGAEADQLQLETKNAITRGLFSAKHNCLITPETVQDFAIHNPQITLPDIITIKTHSRITDTWLNANDSKKGIITRSAGYDHIEHLAEAAHITSLREYCVNAVAQTAIKFLYATAGMLNSYEKLSVDFERNRAPSFMELGKHRRATVFGVGKIGKAIYELLEANSLDVFGVDIRAAELAKQYSTSVRFLTAEEALKTSDIIINAMNLTKNHTSNFCNAGYFSGELFALSQKPLIFINVTRGEIAPEEILLEQLDLGRIVGLGLDVFTDESEFAKVLRGESDGTIKFGAAEELLRRSQDRSANIYLQPHQGFNSDLAVMNKASETMKHLLAWYRNDNRHFDEELPYYS